MFGFSPYPFRNLPAIDSGPCWTQHVASCTRCGASWHVPKDEPHQCIADDLDQLRVTVAKTVECLTPGPGKTIRVDTARDLLAGKLSHKKPASKPAMNQEGPKT